MPLRRLAERWLLAVAGGVDGVKLCTTLLLLSLPPLVMVDESSEESDAALPFLSFLFCPAACFFRPRYSPEVPTICACEAEQLMRVQPQDNAADELST